MNINTFNLIQNIPAPLRVWQSWLLTSVQPRCCEADTSLKRNQNTPSRFPFKDLKVQIKIEVIYILLSHLTVELCISEPCFCFFCNMFWIELRRLKKMLFAWVIITTRCTAADLFLSRTPSLLPLGELVTHRKTAATRQSALTASTSLPVH